ncbi:hypothetical protein LIER_26816 [Lithospermum erythrorhizon]|uniref:Uncharacterized protein n=1 Tax=Lithospermum erythrorhizon TaxID=34254 RepID=A0AAV3RBB5_LITER
MRHGRFREAKRRPEVAIWPPGSASRNRWRWRHCPRGQRNLGIGMCAPFSFRRRALGRGDNIKIRSVPLKDPAKVFKIAKEDVEKTAFVTEYDLYFPEGYGLRLEERRGYVSVNGQQGVLHPDWPEHGDLCVLHAHKNPRSCGS